MKKEVTSWYSPSMEKEMPIVSYGHFGFALLMVPTAGADYLEYERFGLIEEIAPFINSGKVKVFSIDCNNKDTWMNDNEHPPHKSYLHNQWNHYVYNEVIPFIKNNTSNDTPIYITGASFGALHSMNLFLKRPDLLNGVLAMSGVYHLTEYTKGYFDDNVYFNSPMHYMPGLTDHNHLETIRRSNHIHILTGSGPYEDPESGGRFAKVLYDKGIHYEFDNWGPDWKHDWPTWKAMLPHYLSTRF